MPYTREYMPVREFVSKKDDRNFEGMKGFDVIEWFEEFLAKLERAGVDLSKTLVGIDVWEDEDKNHLFSDTILIPYQNSLSYTLVYHLMWSKPDEFGTQAGSRVRENGDIEEIDSYYIRLWWD